MTQISLKVREYELVSNTCTTLYLDQYTTPNAFSLTPLHIPLMRVCRPVTAPPTFPERMHGLSGGTPPRFNLFDATPLPPLGPECSVRSVGSAATGGDASRVLPSSSLRSRTPVDRFRWVPGSAESRGFGYCAWSSGDEAEEQDDEADDEEEEEEERDRLSDVVEVHGAAAGARDDLAVGRYKANRSKVSVHRHGMR